MEGGGWRMGGWRVEGGGWGDGGWTVEMRDERREKREERREKREERREKREERSEGVLLGLGGMRAGGEWGFPVIDMGDMILRD